jgi:hypothetical protein
LRVTKIVANDHYILHVIDFLEYHSLSPFLGPYWGTGRKPEPVLNPYPNLKYAGVCKRREKGRLCTTTLAPTRESTAL